MNIELTNLSKQSIAFNRGKLVCSNKDRLNDPRDLKENRNLLLISLVKELENFGYYLSSEILCRITEDEIKEVFEDVIKPIQDLFKDRKDYIPLYPGFPDQVISLSDAELFTNSEKVYSGDLEGFLKDNPWICDKNKEEIKMDPTRLINIMSEEEFMDIPNQIMSSGNSITENTRRELVWFLDSFQDLKIPERIPFKETLCIVVSKRPDYKISEINDVLRYGIYLMGGNPELLNVPKKIKESSWSNNYIKNPDWRNLKGLPRSKRKEICKRIEDIVSSKGLENSVKDAKKFYGHWILLSERVHPGEYFLIYPESSTFFMNLKSKELNKQFKTFGSVVQSMYDSDKPIVDIAKYVSSRPGEFLRKFDSFIRRKGNTEEDISKIFDIFIDTDGMKNKTLLELSNYYDRRTQNINRFVEVPNHGKKMLPALEPLSEGLVSLIQDLIYRKVLLNINSRVLDKDLLNKTVYIDPDIKKIPIPKGMRDKTISVPSGTRLKISDKSNKIRFFVHWIQKEEDEDLDLHAFLYSDSSKKSISVGWNSVLRKGNVAIHSGDVLNRPGKCAEYIDVDIDMAKKEGYTHIVTDIYNFKGRGLNSLPCWCGYSTGEERFGNPSLEWYPQQVDLMVPMKSKFTSTAGFIVDLNSREIIIVDCDLEGFTSNNSTTLSVQQALVNYFKSENKFNTYNIIYEYYKARGANIIDKMPEEEDIVVDEKIDFLSISQDYVRVLNIIGE